MVTTSSMRDLVKTIEIHGWMMAIVSTPKSPSRLKEPLYSEESKKAQFWIQRNKLDRLPTHKTESKSPQPSLRINENSVALLSNKQSTRSRREAGVSRPFYLQLISVINLNHYRVEDGSSEHFDELM